MAGNSRPSRWAALFYALPLMAVALIAALLIWAFVQHGTAGFLHVNHLARYAFAIPGVLALGLAALTFLHWRKRRAPRARGRPWFSALLIAISVLLFIFFALVWLVLAGFPGANVRAIIIPPVSIPPATSLTRFAVGSDAHFGARNNDPAATAQMLAQVRDPANGYDQFFFLGDLVQYGFMDRQWQTALTAFSSTAAALPVHFAPGNHDTLFAGFERYLQYCAPVDVPLAMDPQLWYRLDAGNAHFLVLDLEWSADGYTAAEAAWLESQLRSIPAGDWKIVLSHGFYYGSGIVEDGWKWYDNPETISRLTPLFEKYGVDLVVSGHNHSLELLQHAGVYYAICGAFGGVPDPPRTYSSPASLWYDSGHLAFLDVGITGNRATLNFRAPDSSILKSFAITHHTPNPS